MQDVSKISTEGMSFWGEKVGEMVDGVEEKLNDAVYRRPHAISRANRFHPWLPTATKINPIPKLPDANESRMVDYYAASWTWSCRVAKS